MTTRSWILAGAAALALVVVGVYGRSCRARHQEQVATTQAAQHATAAVAAAAQGVVHDQAAQAHVPTIQADDAAVSRLQAEVARLRAALAHPPVPPAVPGVPQPDPSSLPVVPLDGAAALDQAKDALIEAQGKEIADLKVLVVDLTAARDAWRTSAQEREKEAIQERLARVAAQGAAKAERWKGRFEGFAVGVAADEARRLM